MEGPGGGLGNFLMTLPAGFLRVIDRRMRIESLMGAFLVIGGIVPAVAVHTGKLAMDGIEKILRHQYFFLRLQRSHGAASAGSSLQRRFLVDGLPQIFLEQILIGVTGDAGLCVSACTEHKKK